MHHKDTHKQKNQVKKKAETLIGRVAIYVVKILLLTLKLPGSLEFKYQNTKHWWEPAWAAKPQMATVDINMLACWPRSICLYFLYVIKI